MPDAALRQATYEDLKAVPENMVAEILFGTLVTHPRPAPRHTTAASALGVELGNPFQRGRGGPGGWLILDEPELHLGPHVVVPDIAGWQRERLPALPDTAWIETPPDWACEVPSPSTERYDRGDKRRICATYGVAHLWLLDPVAKLLEVFALRDQLWVLFDSLADGADVKAPPFEAVPFPIANLWPLDPPPPAAT